jgi:hypothetical protein
MKTLYVDIDAEITDLLGKVSALKGSVILLVIPKGAQIFKNGVNFKLLKQKALEEKKELQIFTNDETGQKLVEKNGLKLYQGHLRKRTSIVSAQLGKLPNKEVKKQEFRKVSITEISDKARKSIPKVPLSTPQKKQQKKEQREWTQFFLFSTLRKKTVIAFTTLSVLFFAVVFYVAVPSATISLTPASNVLETTLNIIFADPNKEQALFRNPSSHVISTIPIELTFEKSILYKPTGKVFTGSSARCNLKVLNERTTAWTLLPQTRFQDSSGVVYRSNDEVEVPAARFQVVKDENGNAQNQKVPGSLIVGVEADDFDENGNVIGARGNLPTNTKFSLPGLSKFNQGLLSAVNERPCQGGVTQFYSIVTEDDVKASQQKIQDEMEKTARQYLVDYVEAENVKRADREQSGVYTSSLLLFDHPQAIRFEVIETQVPPDLEGQKMEEFSVAGKMKVNGFAYEQQNYYDILEQNLLAKVHPSKVISSVDYNSTTSNLVFSDSDLTDLSRIKMSVTVRGVEEYNFDPRSNKGKELIERILQYVPGKSSVEASYFIANLEEIQKSYISIWPFWKNTLPERTSSISIKVQ